MQFHDEVGNLKLHEQNSIGWTLFSFGPGAATVTRGRIRAGSE